jgi:hypothetical protein
MGLSANIEECAEVNIYTLKYDGFDPKQTQAECLGRAAGGALAYQPRGKVELEVSVSLAP